MLQLRATPHPVSDEQAFEAIKAGVDALPAGTKMFLNSGTPSSFTESPTDILTINPGEFYDNSWGTGNLKLLSRFFAKYPEYAERTFLSVKGGIRGRTPDGS